MSFDFKYNTAFYNQHFYIDPNWLQWFIGFAEGDGGIFTDKNDYISFVITQNESKILYHIKDKLGRLYKLALLFNGRGAPLFLLHRINQLQEWIKILNSKSYFIIFNNRNNSISFTDAWISGFTDAEGAQPF